MKVAVVGANGQLGTDLVDDGGILDQRRDVGLGP